MVFLLVNLCFMIYVIKGHGALVNEAGDEKPLIARNFSLRIPSPLLLDVVNRYIYPLHFRMSKKVTGSPG